MTESDTARMRLQDVPEALALLTRLPVSHQDYRGIRSAWAWPVAGCLVAILSGIPAALALWAGLGANVAALLAIITAIAATGAMHEDGLADSLDGFWGGQGTERRLEIMKDSRIGTYGVIGLILSALLRWALLVEILQSGHLFAPLLAVAALSRAPMVAVMALLPNARGGGLSAGYGRPQPETMWLAVVAALIIALMTTGFAGLGAAIAVALAAFAWASVASAKIGGQTGDVLGATQQFSEIAALLAFASLL